MSANQNDSVEYFKETLRRLVDKSDREGLLNLLKTGKEVRDTLLSHLSITERKINLIESSILEIEDKDQLRILGDGFAGGVVKGKGDENESD